MTDEGRAGVGWLRTTHCADTFCIEVLGSADEVLVRNSGKSNEVLRFTPGEWSDFLEGVKRGDFD